MKSPRLPEDRRSDPKPRSTTCPAGYEMEAELAARMAPLASSLRVVAEVRELTSLLARDGGILFPIEVNARQS